MEVILIQDIRGTGKAGDIVKVSDGFARNFLIRKKLAIIADKKNINALESKKHSIECRAAKAQEEAAELAEKLNGQTFNISMKSGSNGKLFGSVTMKNVAEVIFETTGLKVDKKKLTSNVEIKNYGGYTITAKLTHEISAEFKLMVMEK